MGSDSVFTHYSLRRGPQGDFNPSIWDNGVVWTERSKVQAFQHFIYFWKRRTWTGVILVWTLPFLAHFLMSCCEQRPCLCQILDIKLDAHCPIHAKCASNTISTTGQPGQSWGAGTGAFQQKCVFTPAYVPWIVCLSYFPVFQIDYMFPPGVWMYMDATGSAEASPNNLGP